MLILTIIFGNFTISWPNLIFLLKTVPMLVSYLYMRTQNQNLILKKLKNLKKPMPLIQAHDLQLQQILVQLL
jgi:hypothetical protein